MSKIYIPTNSAEDWKQFLAEPEKHWKRGYSAMALAYCWQEADGIPQDILNVLSQSGDLQNLEALLVIPEHKVPLPGGITASQNDVWVLARTHRELVSIAVEGKVFETFGPTVGEWLKDASPGKRQRLNYICELLELEMPVPEHIRYQVLHRTASAVIEAQRFLATQAIMVVHSFSQDDEWYSNYEDFLYLFNASGKANEIVSIGSVSSINLNLAWVRGEKRFLEA